ncbi:M48 family metallopeptidase [Flexibacter flexilis]|nr:SprT family zinc-dependent metalloprotease [Flexibacter flexilis]
MKDQISKQLLVSGIEIELLRKNVKTIRLMVRAPRGQVRVTAPMRTPEAVVMNFIESKIAWIRKHQERFAQRQSLVNYEFVSGEKHLIWGREVELKILNNQPVNAAILREDGLYLCFKKQNSTPDDRALLLKHFYQKQAAQILPDMAAKWQKIIGVKVESFQFKQMKTKWGTCNTRTHRIWLNLELIKLPPVGLEYVLVHELVHLLEASHNARFYALMTQFMPDWKTHQNMLRNYSIREE